MKIKFNWDIGILLSLFIFIIFIVYIAFFFPNVESQLVSDQYYEDEIKYQDIINEKKNTLELSHPIKILMNSDGIQIYFPHYKGKKIEGFVTLFRYSSKNLDVKKYFEIFDDSEKKLFIPKKLLKIGYYKLIIRWISDKNKKYFFEKELFWKS
ncbi:FixH family protein [Blattabacterium cuenoti]|uniref:FixH family protein n=1 Tax=Blattabacterium cuenoti TaxID=1653831 RepID=UPI00163D06DA|nr:FixH family protein [Blattabacterium cuenoti]